MDMRLRKPVVLRHGPDLALEVVDFPRPKPSRGDLLIKVACAGCNPKDWKAPHYTGKKANPGDGLGGSSVFWPSASCMTVRSCGTAGWSTQNYNLAKFSTLMEMNRLSGRAKKKALV
ncbi:hypothetical protein LTR57_025032 [Friedmanniomyces endolithicus]|nr:hypothetical protein LTR57_025032 [Friedmanniomyces endolithicus]